MFDNPTATEAIFEQIQQGPWKVRVHVIGSGYVKRAVPAAAVVGDVEVQQITLHPDGRGFTGLMDDRPRHGDVLKVGWLGSPLVATPVVYRTGGVG